MRAGDREPAVDAATVVIRCDAGPRVGVGHVVRCRQLAIALSELGARCVMVGPARVHAVAADETLFADWIERPDWTSPEADAEALAEIANECGARYAVLDDYRVDGAYQKVMLEAGVRWMQQFDASKPQSYWADMVVNASPYETLELHRDELRKPEALGLFGPHYAILRPEFPPIRRRPAARPVERILLTFGGGDDQGCVARALSALLEGSNQPGRIVVVSGSQNPRNAEIARLIERLGPDRASLLVNPPDVSSIYADCDLALLAAGTTGHELASCGIPMILLATAENQVRQGLGWQSRGAAIYLGRAPEITVDDMRAAIAEICADDARRARMAEIGPSLVDGRGARRLAACLLERPFQ